jgi:TRAP transporter TAXI family solute receptor
MPHKNMRHSDAISRRNLLKNSAALGAITIAGCLGDDDDGETLSVGTAGSGTPTEAAGQALARAMDEHSDVSMTVQNTDGWTSNMYEYDGGSFYTYGVDNNSLSKARDGEGPFEEEPVDSMPYQGFQYTTLDMYFVATEESGIESTDDLLEGGYDVFPLEPGAGTRLSTEEILQEVGIWEANEMLAIDFADIAGAVEEGRVDAMVIYGVNGVALTGWAEEIDVRSDGILQLVETGEDIQAAIEEHPGLSLEEVEPYGWEQDVTAYTDTTHAWALIGQWVFGDEVSEHAAYEFARVSSEHWETIEESDATALDHSDPETMTAGVLEGIPIHPGVAEFWEEEGVWDDSWERGEAGE